MPDDEIKKYLDDNKHLLHCQKCNGKFPQGEIYQTFSASPSTCMSALLCDKVAVPDLDLPKLDINFREVAGETDIFFIHPERCCYGVHCGLSYCAGGIAYEYQKCGWDAAFKDMPLHKRMETNLSTSETITHLIRACPDEYNREGKVTWLDFIKVSIMYASTFVYCSNFFMSTFVSFLNFRSNVCCIFLGG